MGSSLGCGSIESTLRVWGTLLSLLLGSAAALWLPAIAAAQELPGEGRRLDLVGVDVTQDALASGAIPLDEIRRQGQLVFSSPFSKADGYGDGPALTQSS